MKKLSQRIREAMRRLSDASVALSWAGAGPPEDYGISESEQLMAAMEFDLLMHEVDALENER